MTTVTASASSAVTSIFGAAATLATQTGNTINTVGKALSMVDRYVDAAAEDQMVRYAAEREHRNERIINNVTLDIVEENLKILEKLEANPKLKKMFEAKISQITEAVNIASGKKIKTEE